MSLEVFTITDPAATLLPNAFAFKHALALRCLAHLLFHLMRIGERAMHVRAHDDPLVGSQSLGAIQQIECRFALVVAVSRTRDRSRPVLAPGAARGS